jgi:hypothetical protein
MALASSSFSQGTGVASIEYFLQAQAAAAAAGAAVHFSLLCVAASLLLAYRTALKYHRTKKIKNSLR